MPDDAGAEEKVLYREVVYYRAWTYAALLALIALYVVIGVPAAREGMKSTAVIFALVAVALILVFINFWRLEFVITEGTVGFRFGVIKKRFPRSSITSCEPYELKFSNYLGYGIRRGLDGTTAYNTRNGPGVKITIDGRSRPYVVSVNNPEQICRILSSGGETRDS